METPSADPGTQNCVRGGPGEAGSPGALLGDLGGFRSFVKVLSRSFEIFRGLTAPSPIVRDIATRKQFLDIDFKSGTAIFGGIPPKKITLKVRSLWSELVIMGAFARATEKMGQLFGGIAP
jgi:hypothetical protein